MPAATINDIHLLTFSERVRYVVVRPSIVCLSVTLVHPSQAIEIFGNVSTPCGTVVPNWPKFRDRETPSSGG